MSEPFKVTIGGEVYSLPATITLDTIEAFNPALKELKAGSTDGDLVDNTVLAVRVVAPALQREHPELTPEAVKSALTADEMAGMRAAMWEVLILSGLYERAAPKAGEGKPPEAPAADNASRTKKSTSAK